MIDRRALLALLLLGCDPAAGTDAGTDAGGPFDGGPTSDGGDSDAAAADAGPMPDGPTAETDLGTAIGVNEGDVDVWRGIPYAAPPVGDLRFRPPQPAAPWDGWRATTDFGPECPQRMRTGTGVTGDEDCLTLNVYAPTDRTAPLPVMVFIHGGAFIQGSSSVVLYDGSSIARRGVIVVTINYRLGALGFLATDDLVAESGEGSAGNYGIRDQIAALAWVQRNAAAFGGDAANVTIFGESAGGVSVCALLGAPSADALFERGVIESGAGCYGMAELSTSTATRPTSAVERGAEIAAAAGCTGDGALECLRGLSADALVDATWMASSSALGLPDIGPNIDGTVLVADTWDRYADGTARDRPVIIGSNADESRSFLLGVPIATVAAYESAVRASLPLVADDLLMLYPASDYATPKAAFEALFSDIGFICPAVGFADLASAGEPTYAYHFTHVLNGAAGARGAQHGDELFFLFDGLGIVPGYTAVAADDAVTELMQAAWVAFARGEAPPDWPAYDPTSPSFRILDDPARNDPSIREGHCDDLRALGVVR
ncbi:MAG: carboxylesterase family protein [Sandaracinaceae bacterium]